MHLWHYWTELNAMIATHNKTYKKRQRSQTQPQLRRRRHVCVCSSGNTRNRFLFVQNRQKLKLSLNRKADHMNCTIYDFNKLCRFYFYR